MGSALKIGGAKGGESKPRQPYKAPDSALSIATAKMLYIISEGEIAGPADDARSFKLDGTPLIAPDGSEAFPGTTWEFRSGSVDQEHIAGFPAAEYEQSAGLPVELRSDVAWTRAITNRDLSAVRVRLSWPQIWEVKTNGDQVGYRIDYAIELSVDGGAFNTVLSATLDDKGTTEYERSHRVDLPQGFNTAVLRVRRLTPNRNDSNFADVMRVKALTEVIDAKLRYPNLALAALQFDASQFSNIPKFSLLCRGRIIKVPNNYDPVTRTYTGSWDGTFKLAYSNNPAWVWYDLLLHRRYGLGRRITADMVDRWSLYEIGRYCDVMVPDGKGGMQPRMTTNVYIQDQVEGYALLSDLASVFRGSSCWNGSKVTVIADIPGNDDGYVFTRSNIVGEFEYGAIALPDRHTRAKISWDNPANEFKTEPTAVTNDDMIGVLGHRMLDVARFACTVEGEAIRHGIWALKSEQYETWTVRFTTGMEGRNIEPGQIIGVADELLSGRANGGRISAATARVITLDFDAQVQPEDRLIVNLPSGKAEGRIVKSVAGRQVTVMADYSELPEPESAWSIESADLGVMRFRVNTIEPKGMHQWEITGVQHEPDKFDAIDHGARVDPQPITVLPPGVIEPPESVAITSRSVVSQGIAVTTMRISWPAVKGAVAYDVEWRKDNGSWLRLPRTGTLGAEVEGIYSGVYQARVSAVSVMDVSSVFAMSALVDLKGKEGLPPAVAFLTTTPLVYGTGLAWGFPAGAEDTERTEIWQSATTNRDDAIKLGDFAYPQAEHEIHGLAAGVSFFYWARLVDRSGNIGPWYPTGVGVNGQSSSNQSEYEEYFKDKISNGALYPALRQEIELISGPPTLEGSVAQRVAAEATARTQAIDAEAAARAQGLLAEAQARGTAITSEAQTRQSADAALGQRIDTVTASAGGNAAAIQSEITARTNADTALGQRIDTVAASSAANSSAISNETTARTNADAALASQIATIRAESGGFDSALNYGFASTVEGWTGSRCTLTVENGRLVAANDGTGTAYLSSPTVSVKGRDHDRVRCRITRRAGSGWTGQVTYATANHASSTSYRKVIPDPGLAVGQTMVLEWDMSQLTNGGSDWSDSTITRFYLWLSPGATDVFEIDWIAVGQIAPSASVASVVDERTARISGDEANASAILGLSSSLQTTNGNVTAAQQAAQAASDKAGGKGEVIYSSTEPATDKRLAQNLWIDTAGAANTPKRWTGSAWVAVTDKVATDAAAAAASALAQVAAKADASALQTLQTTVTNQGNTLTAQGTSITQIKASIGQQPDNLLRRGSFEDGLLDPWVPVTGGIDPTITAVAAHPSAGKAITFYSNSFCGNAYSVLTKAGEQFDVSADIFRNYMTAGQAGHFQMQFIDKAGASLGYFTAFSFTAGGQFQTYTGRITAPAGAVAGRFLTLITPSDGSGRTLWCNIVARRVTAADAANADAISTLSSTVTQQGTTLTSQGQSLLSLTNRMSDAEGVNSAQASAISQMDTTVKQQGTAITAQASRLDGLYVQVNPEMEGDSSGLAGATGGLVGVWTEQSARVEDGIAMGRQVETVQAQMGQTNASVQQVSEVVAGVDGKVSAISSWKTETNASGKKVATGIIQGSDGSVGEILLSADRVAIINGLNGQEASLFVFQNGQLFLNSALINQAFIQELIMGMSIRSQALNSQGLPLLEINFAAGTFTLRGQDANGSTLLNNGGLYVYDANGTERTAVGRLT
ncbi:phage tail protein [Pseudomonas sp. s4]|uniref:TipJ family phage tail tip protein n=1 Tax=Pseudomonas sp. s4 TaxID=353218 RepID=UPI00398D2FC4